MRRPRSLWARLLLLSLLATAAALAAAGWAIGGVLERFATRGLDDRLDAQLMLLAGAVRPDGSLGANALRVLPGFDAGAGWSWRVVGADGRVWRAGPVADLGKVPSPARPLPGGSGPGGSGPGDVRVDGPARPRPLEGRDDAGRRVHGRALTVLTPAGPVRIAAAAPRALAEQPIRAAMAPLLMSLLLLGVALTAAALVQLRLGLRPLRDLRLALARVRAGEADRVPGDQPTELAPLAAELNALLAENAAGLARARGHVANLAHGLKTPLAALIARLDEPGADPDGSLHEQARRIDARVRHHLSRARTAAGGTPARRTVPIALPADDLIGVLARIHADRPVRAAVDLPDLSVAVDAEDLSEMLGNLLDNAWRHARTVVRLGAATDGAFAIVAVEDDGPGLSPAAAAEALRPGRRLDERGDGHGFGLPIVRELAELSGGALYLDRSDLGGLRVRLRLPLSPGRTAPPAVR